jgi:prepilin-type N-terminal cleavage/methylation domain-containing protein
MAMQIAKPRHGKPRAKLEGKPYGFTTIEIVLVLVIIGILATLVITTRAGVQQNQRNTERQRDIKELRDGLEGYFANTNQYPTLANLNDPSWRATNLKAIEPATFQDPSNKSGSVNLVDEPTAGTYTYSVTSASGAPCGSAAEPCTQYTLTATLEGGGKYTKSNLN